MIWRSEALGKFFNMLEKDYSTDRICGVIKKIDSVKTKLNKSIIEPEDITEELLEEI